MAGKVAKQTKAQKTQVSQKGKSGGGAVKEARITPGGPDGMNCLFMCEKKAYIRESAEVIVVDGTVHEGPNVVTWQIVMSKDEIVRIRGTVTRKP